MEAWMPAAIRRQEGTGSRRLPGNPVEEVTRWKRKDRRQRELTQRSKAARGRAEEGFEHWGARRALKQSITHVEALTHVRVPSSFLPDGAGARSAAPAASLASTAAAKANKGEGTPAAPWAQEANHRALPSGQAGTFLPGSPIGSYRGAEGRGDGRAEGGDGGPRAGLTSPPIPSPAPGAAGRGGAAEGRARGRSQSPRGLRPEGGRRRGARCPG